MVAVDNVVVVRKSTSVQKVVDPIVDVGNLLLVDNVPFSEDTQHDEESLLERARDNTQYLVNHVWQLNKERVDEAIVVTLPTKKFRIPREKPIPEARVPTKWEEYAARKGIVKKTRAKKVYDEATGEWKPTWGYRRAKDNTKDWLIEVPDQADPSRDFFEERRVAKKERIAKNETQRLKNIGRNFDAKKGPSTKPAVPVELGVSAEPMERDKDQLRSVADRAKVATASMGKFQDKLKNEKPNVKKGIKRKFDSNVGDMGAEKERYTKLVDKVTGGKDELESSKLTAIAGNVSDDKKNQNKKPRQKSQLRRTSYFQQTSKERKKRSHQDGRMQKKGGKGKK